jgi:VanZ family protein
MRAAVEARFPESFLLILIVMIGTAAAVGVALAAVRIREHRAARLAAIGASLLSAAMFARLLRTGENSIDLIEAFHFIEYGFLTLLFYLAWRPLGDGSSLLLPVLAGTLVGVLDEWFQWFVPGRVGEMRDVAIDAAAVLCGLLFSVGFEPLPRMTLAFRRDSSDRVAYASIIVILASAGFFASAFLAHEIHDGRTGTFRSRSTAEVLDLEARDRLERWRQHPPLEVRALSREDQFMSEALWHVVRRNESASAGDLYRAWWENRILEAYFEPVLDTPSHVSRVGHRWPAEQRAAARLAGERGPSPYVSDAEPYSLYVWPKTMFWLAVSLMVAGVVAARGSSKNPHGKSAAERAACGTLR